MNVGLLELADVHVREEFEKQRGVLKVTERALASAVEALIDFDVDVDGAPARTGDRDADALELTDFLLARTAAQLG